MRNFMISKKATIVLIVIVLMFVSMGYSCGGGSSNPNRGFDVRLVVRFLRTGGGGYDLPSQGSVSGVFLYPTSQNTIGTITSFDVFVNHVRNIPGAKVPGRWRFSGHTLDPRCTTFFYLIERNVRIGETETFWCESYAPPFIASPENIDVNSAPSTITIIGDGLSADNGAPKIAIYDPSGNLLTSLSANTVNTEKGRLTISTPTNMSQNGNYLLIVHNVQADGSWQVVGVANILVTGNPTPDPPDLPDPCLSNLPACQYP